MQQLNPISFQTALDECFGFVGYEAPKPARACRKRLPSDVTCCSFTLPAALQQAIIRISDAEDRSFSATVRVALERYLSNPA